jgi:outer membrane protein OmpA-like peptidoglycan-associated protein
MGVLGKRAAAQGLDASGLANSLLAEKSEIHAAAPSGLTQLLGTGPSIVSKTAETAARYAPAATDVRTYAEHRGGIGRWLPLLLLALGALALLSFLRGRTPRTTVDNAVQRGVDLAKNALSNITLPGGVTLSVPSGSINDNLARFLGNAGAVDLPRTFVFDHLNFDSGSTQLTPDSNKTVNDLAQVLKAYPNAQVQVVGHTDNDGSAEANQALSLARAEAVKGILVSEGVAADRIATQGFGQDRPVASNDTEEGRARNRRIELNVTRK